MWQTVFLLRKLPLHTVVVLCLSLLRTACLEAQVSLLEESWRWIHFTERDGLPSKQVYSLLEAEGGTTWAGTFKGLAWYDGYRWHSVGEDDGLPEISPSFMHHRSGGGLFVVCRNRLYTGDQEGFQHIQLPFDLKDAAGFADGSLLLYSGTALYRYGDAELSPVAGPAGLPGKAYTKLSQTRPGKIWLQTAKAIYRFEEDRWVLENSGRKFGHITEDSAGRRFGSILVPLEDRGLWMWEPGEPPQRYPEGRIDLIEFFAASADGRLVVVYESGDILVRWDQEWALLNPLPEQMKYILSIGFRANGDLWVGTEKGLFFHRLSSRLWTQWKKGAESLRNRVDEILVAGNGVVWLGTDAGIEIRHPDDTVEWVDNIGAIDLSIITGLAEDAQGHVWISSGSRGKGAHRWDGRTWSFFGPEQGLGARKIHRIHRDRAGRLWFLGLAFGGEGTSKDANAVYVYQDGQFSPFQLEGELGEGRVYSFAEGLDGSRWFGTINGLLRWREGEWSRWNIEGSAHLREGEWTPWNVEQALKNDRIFVLAVDTTGRLWFGDQYQGLGYVDSGYGPRYLTTEDGLINNEVWDLEVDAEGTLWVATRGGLCSYRDGIWSHFGPASGLEARELWPLATSAEHLYIGTAGEGAYILEFGEADQHLPRVDIDHPLMDQNRVVLRWQPYAHWGRQASNQIRTRYRLDRGAWSEWSNRREAVLEGLGAGQHVFQLQGASLFGLVDTTGYSAAFSIPYPYYRQASFIFPVGGLLIAVLGLLIVLVERRRRHNVALSLSEARYRSFFEESPIALWEHDYSALMEYLDSLQELGTEALRTRLERSYRAVYKGLRLVQITDVNRATLELFQARGRDDLRAKLTRIFRRDSLPAFREGMLALAQGQTRFSHETVAYDMSGQRLNIILSFVVAPGHGQALQRVLASMLDVTPQKKAAEQMQRSMWAAEEASQAKSEFVANISHEIRTPMNAIIGMTELVLDSELKASQRDYLEGVKVSADTLLTLVNSVLDLSKIESGKLMLEISDLSLRDTLQEAVHTLSLRAREKGLALNFRVAPAVPEILRGDPLRLKQIFINLLSNAIKFTAEGEVAVEVGCETAGDKEVDLHMIVRDTGIGVPAAKQETIFEAFTQADSSTTRQYGGTGLGLSITAQLVHMMNGRIWLDSEEGQGSTFHIVVRLEVPSEAGKALPPRHGFNSTTPLDEAAYTLPTLRVLLAEDNELNQKVAVGMLERMGHSVDIVANGIDTLDMLERKDFDLVLMDVQMPELDGLEATAAIRARERERGGHIPIVGLTAHAMTGDPERCLAAGMDDYAAKPIRRDRLFAIFARHFGQSAELLPAPPQGELEVAKVLDQDDLWERFDGDIELFKNARELFLRDAPKLVQKIQQTIASGKANSLASAVHELKGMAVNLSAGAVAKAARNLERISRGDSLEGASNACDELVRELDRFYRELASFEAPE